MRRWFLAFHLPDLPPYNPQVRWEARYRRCMRGPLVEHAPDQTHDRHVVELLLINSGTSLEQCSTQDQRGDGKIDNQACNIDERCDERSRGARGIEPDPLQDEGKHRPSKRTECHDSDERSTDSEGDQHPVFAVIIKAQVLPNRDAHNPDKPFFQTIRWWQKI
jgi:hypothetical protein